MSVCGGVIDQKLQYILDTMQVLVYDPRTIRRLIDEIEASCPQLSASHHNQGNCTYCCDHGDHGDHGDQTERAHHGPSGPHGEHEKLRNVITSIRKHLAASRVLDEAEDQLKRAGAHGEVLNQRLQPFHASACESWRAWRAAYREYQVSIVSRTGSLNGNTGIRA